jgi:hypothetical protein
MTGVSVPQEAPFPGFSTGRHAVSFIPFSLRGQAVSVSSIFPFAGFLLRMPGNMLVRRGPDRSEGSRHVGFTLLGIFSLLGPFSGHRFGRRCQNEEKLGQQPCF